MVGDNKPVLPASALGEWQEECVDYVLRQMRFGRIVHRVAPHVGFGDPALLRLDMYAIDCPRFYPRRMPSVIILPEIELPRKVYQETLRDCVKTSLDCFSLIPLQAWIVDAFNVRQEIIAQFSACYANLGTQLQNREIFVDRNVIAVSSI